MYRFLYNHKVSFFSGKYFGVGLLGYMANVFNFIRNRQTVSPEWLYHLVLPPAMHENSSFSASLPIVNIVNNLYFSHSVRCTIVTFHGFNLYFAND